jgi:hypothetical protein
MDLQNKVHHMREAMTRNALDKVKAQGGSTSNLSSLEKKLVSTESQKQLLDNGGDPMLMTVNTTMNNSSLL